MITTKKRVSLDTSELIEEAKELELNRGDGLLQSWICKRVEELMSEVWDGPDPRRQEFAPAPVEIIARKIFNQIMEERAAELADALGVDMNRIKDLALQTEG